MGINQITYTNPNRREVTYEIPAGRSLTHLSVYDEDMLLQFDGGGTAENCVVLQRLRNSDIYIK